MSQLARVAGFATKSQTLVVSAATNRLSTKPDISLPEDAGHHGEHAIALPNMSTTKTTSSMGKLLIGGNLSASNAFTSKLYLFYLFGIRNIFKNIVLHEYVVRLR